MGNCWRGTKARTTDAALVFPLYHGRSKVVGCRSDDHCLDDLPRSEVLSLIGPSHFHFSKGHFMSRDLGKAPTRGYKGQAGHIQSLWYKHWFDIYMYDYKLHINCDSVTRQQYFVYVFVKSTVSFGDSHPQPCPPVKPLDHGNLSPNL